MILNTAPANQAELSNVSSVAEFNLTANAKAFNILSSTLYSNKIRAIVRELSCNALDSHIAAGCADKPFDVHIPNKIEPWFAIRDYGTGLSHDEVMKIYTVYFKSTKSESNDFIGAMGLGSKSPFSYTTTFSVTAIQNGKKNLYTAFINEVQVPSIALMGQFDTDEPNGLEVKIAVERENDFYSFVREAEHVFSLFDVKPNILGGQININERYIEDADITLPNFVKLTNQKSTNAVMGNIAYPIDIDDPQHHFGDLSAYLSTNIDILFEMGEIEFQPSREGLSYIPCTIQAIKQKLEKLHKFLSKDVEKKFKSMAEWDRAVFISEMSNSIYRACITNIAAKYPAVSGAYTTTSGLVKRSNITLTENKASTHGVKVSGFSTYYGRRTIHRFCTRWNSKQGYVSSITITPNSTTWFVLNDTKIGATERAKYHWSNTTDTRFGRNDTVFVLDKGNDTYDYEAVLKALGNPSNVIKASELMEKPRAKTAKVVKNDDIEVSVLTRNYHDDWKWDRKFANNLGLAAQRYYVKAKGYDLVSEKSGSNVVTFIKKASQLGLNVGGDVVVIRDGDADLLKKFKNLVNLEEAVTQYLKDNHDEILKRKLAFCAYLYYSKYDLNVVNHSELAEEHPIRVLHGMFDKCINDASTINNSWKMLKEYGLIDDAAEQVNELDEFVETQIAGKYPMLSQVYEYRVNRSVCTQYVKFCDSVDAANAVVL